jgi:hypothetical protein
MPDEEVAGEQRRPIQAAHVPAPRPLVDRRQQHLITLGAQLLIYQLLAVAPGPEHVPMLIRAALASRIASCTRQARRLRLLSPCIRQGFALLVLRWSTKVVTWDAVSLRPHSCLRRPTSAAEPYRPAHRGAWTVRPLVHVGEIYPIGEIPRSAKVNT